MRTVMDEFHVLSRYKTDGDVGIEIEVEGRHLPMRVKYWNTEEDGSLRGLETAEYVLKKPSTLVEAEMALKELEDAYVLKDTVVDDSVRAGVHVHINSQDLTIIELYNFITLYIVLEELLVKFCGEFREGNLFCLRSSDADTVIRELQAAARSGDFMRLVTDNLRYSSMNLKALGVYGSLEFRAMRGTRDLGLILQWARILLNLREVAKTFQEPSEIIRRFSAGETDGFLQKCLGDDLAPFIEMEGRKAMLVSGMRRAQDVAFCCKWDKYNNTTIGGLEFPLGTEYPDEPLEDF